MAYSKPLSLRISSLTKAPCRIASQFLDPIGILKKKEKKKKSEKVSPPADGQGLLYEHPRVDLAELEASLRRITYAYSGFTVAQFHKLGIYLPQGVCVHTQNTELNSLTPLGRPLIL